jgi:RecB family exonuclease
VARHESSWDPTLGGEIQPASRVLILNVSRIRDFQTCRRMFFLRWVLRLVGEPWSETDAAWIGSSTHDALNVLHIKGQVAQSHRPADASPDIPNDPRVASMIRTHTVLCPSENAEYIDGEVESRWLIARKSVLITGRFDALWRYPDGTLEVRDYKTGRCPDSLDGDLGAAIYLLLAANWAASQTRPSHATTPIRVVYEGLASPDGKLVSVSASKLLLRKALNEVLSLAEHIRREKSFPANPSVSNCRMCDYRHSCPYSQAVHDDN